MITEIQSSGYLGPRCHLDVRTTKTKMTLKIKEMMHVFVS